MNEIAGLILSTGVAGLLGGLLLALYVVRRTIDGRHDSKRD